MLAALALAIAVGVGTAFVAIHRTGPSSHHASYSSFFSEPTPPPAPSDLHMAPAPADAQPAVSQQQASDIATSSLAGSGSIQSLDLVTVTIDSFTLGGQPFTGRLAWVAVAQRSEAAFGQNPAGFPSSCFSPPAPGATRPSECAPEQQSLAVNRFLIIDAVTGTIDASLATSQSPAAAS